MGTAAAATVTSSSDDNKSGPQHADGGSLSRLSHAQLSTLLGPGNYSEIARDAEPPLSTSHVSRVLRGKSSPSLDVASRIATAVGITLAELQTYLDHRRANPIPSTRARVVDNPNAKLSREKAMEIRERRSEGESVDDLADEYGVSKQAISDVLRGVSYPAQ